MKVAADFSAEIPLTWLLYFTAPRVLFHRIREQNGERKGRLPLNESQLAQFLEVSHPRRPLRIVPAKQAIFFDVHSGDHFQRDLRPLPLPGSD